MMHKELVEDRRWIGEQRFLHALNYCMLLPGPEAQQLAIYIGWLMHRTIGGLVAGLLFIVPIMQGPLTTTNVPFQVIVVALLTTASSAAAADSAAADGSLRITMPCGIGL